MDLKAVHAKLGELLTLDSLDRTTYRDGTLAVAHVGDGARTTILTGLSVAEWKQILVQRRKRAQDELRKLGFVAAHDGSAPTLRQFRDRQIDMPPPTNDAKPIPMSDPNFSPGFP